MALAVPRGRVGGERARARLRRVAPAAALVGLVAVSAFLRTRAIDAGYWIDEGLSVGIADHPLADIPGLLRQDGSPPLYYLLLAVWTSLFGNGEAATHSLSLLAALAAIPAALWAGRALFGARAGWIAAVIAATLPLLTVHAQETRMYALVALLSLGVAVTFVLAFVRGERRALVAFVVLAVAIAYTHNWGLLLLFGFACALPVAARARGTRATVRDAAMAGAAVAVAYAPWVPTLLDQAEHTGAPWSTTPNLGDIAKPLAVPLGEGLVAALVFAVAAFGLVRGWRGEAAVLMVALVFSGAAAWTLAQLEPGWADRYMAVFVGPVLLLAAAGLAKAGRAGLVALLAAAVVWAAEGTPSSKSNAREVAAVIEPGDIVVVTHPEQIAVVHHYAREQGVRWATALGPVSDPRVFDWRDAVERLGDADPPRVLEGLVGSRRLVLIGPATTSRGGPEWIALVSRKATEWEAAAGRYGRVASLAPKPRHGTDLRAVVYELREP